MRRNATFPDGMRLCDFVGPHRWCQRVWYVQRNRFNELEVVGALFNFFTPDAKADISTNFRQRRDSSECFLDRIDAVVEMIRQKRAAGEY